MSAGGGTMATVLDTRKIARRFKEAGVPDAQAEVFIETMPEVRDADIQQLATKADIEALRGATKADIDALRAATKADVGILKAELEGKIDAAHWKVIGTVALLLLVHLGAVWGIVASVVGRAG